MNTDGLGGSRDGGGRERRPDWTGVALVAVQLALFALVACGPRHVAAWPDWPPLAACLAPWVGCLLLLVGACLLGDALLRLGRRLSALPRPVDDAVLIVRGAFAIVRHPMYGGGALLAAGWALCVRGSLTLLWAALLLLLFDLKSRHEERLLRERFPAYADYQRRVRRLIPFIH